MSEDEDEGPSRKPTPYPRSHREDDSHEEHEQASEPEPESVTEPKRRPRIGRMGARITVALLSVLAVLVSGYAYTVVSTLQDSAHSGESIAGLSDDDARAPPDQDGAIDILLVGTDARTDMQGNPLPRETLKTLRTERSLGVNTDTLIVLRVPKNGGSPTAVSIPRDTWLRKTSGKMGKINSVFGLAKARKARKLQAHGVTDSGEIARKSDQAGRTALIRTVQRFTQVHIDHYAEVNLLGFYLLTKALGGVTVCLKQPTHDKDSGAHFRAGVQELSASEALSFVRQRKNIPGAMGRINRQQAFLASALHKVLSAGTLTDTAKLRDLAEAVRRSVVLDKDLKLLEFAERVKGIASGEVSFVTIPVITLGGRSPTGLSIVKVDRAKVRGFMDSLVASSGSTEPSADPSATATTGGGGGSGSRVLPSRTAPGVPCVY